MTIVIGFAGLAVGLLMLYGLKWQKTGLVVTAMGFCLLTIAAFTADLVWFAIGGACIGIVAVTLGGNPKQIIYIALLRAMAFALLVHYFNDQQWLEAAFGGLVTAIGLAVYDRISEGHTPKLPAKRSRA